MEQNVNTKEVQYQNILKKIHRIDEQIALLDARKLILNSQLENLNLAMQREAARSASTENSQKES